ncbi:M48 family metallopeptidase [Ottowia sp. GY511]|nr:M48 family metallopeptidase [Ottowia sp. GY511]
MTVVATGVVALWLAGCSATGGSGSGVSADGKVGAVLDMAKAVTVSEDELKNASLQLRAAEDKQARVAPPKNKYAQRLERLTRKHQNEDGMTLNYKVYLSPQVNANATPDGSIRVYSGLMDLMNDQEMLGIIGHEIGHVKLGHSMSAMRTAYMASAGRKAAASSRGAGGALAASELGEMGEALVNSQFSQSQETSSDDYGLAFMKKHGYNVKAMESAFRKLEAQRNGKKASAMENMMSTHPDPGARADRMRDMASK